MSATFKRSFSFVLALIVALTAVMAVSGVDVSAASNKPGKVTGVRIKVSSKKPSYYNVQHSWKKPKGKNISHYEVQDRCGGIPSIGPLIWTTERTSANRKISRERWNYKYQYRVRAVSRVNGKWYYGKWSSWSKKITIKK